MNGTSIISDNYTKNEIYGFTLLSSDFVSRKFPEFSEFSTNVDEITKPCFPLRRSTQIIISIHIQLHLIYREIQDIYTSLQSILGSNSH